MMKLALMRTTKGMEDSSAAEDRFIRVTSLIYFSPNKCIIVFK
jgi:hypothetical protein